MNVYLNQGTRIITFIVTKYFMYPNVFFKTSYLCVRKLFTQYLAI